MADESPSDEQAARIGAAVLEGLRRADQQQLALLIGRAFLSVGAPGLSTSAPAAAIPPAASAVPFVPPSAAAVAAFLPPAAPPVTPFSTGAPTLPALLPVKAPEPPLLLLPSEPPPEEGQRSEPRLPVLGPPPTPSVEVVGDRFQLVVAQGGDRRGRIFIARDRNDGGEVTLRIFSLRMGHDAASLMRLQDRVSRCRDLADPHLERLIAAGFHNGELFSVSELVRGRPLSDLIANGPMPEAQALRLILQAARALQHAWDQGRVVHGDLDADLLVVRSGGSEPVLVVTGMGMPRTAWDDPSRVGPLQIPWYVAPERLRGEPDEDPTSDMYALGAILYHLIAGAPAFQGGATEVRAGHLGPVVPEIARRRAGVSPATQQLLQVALSKAPGTRFASYSGFIAAITKALVGIGGFSADLVEPRRSGGTSRTYRRQNSGQVDANAGGTDRIRRDAAVPLPANPPPLTGGTGTDRFRREAIHSLPAIPGTPAGLPTGHPGAAAAPPPAQMVGGTERIRRDAQGRPVTTSSATTPAVTQQKPPSDRIARGTTSSATTPAAAQKPPSDRIARGTTSSATNSAAAQKPPSDRIARGTTSSATNSAGDGTTTGTPRPATSRIGRVSSAQWQPGQEHIQGQIPPEARPRTDRMTQDVAKDAQGGGPQIRVNTSEALLPRHAAGATASGAQGIDTPTSRFVRGEVVGPPKPVPSIANPYPSDGGIMSSRIIRRDSGGNAAKLLTPVPAVVHGNAPGPLANTPGGAVPVAAVPAAPVAMAEQAPVDAAIATYTATAATPSPVPDANGLFPATDPASAPAATSSAGAMPAMSMAPITPALPSSAVASAGASSLTPTAAPLPAALTAPLPAALTAAPSLLASASPAKDDEARPSTDAVSKLGDPALDRREGRRPIPPATVYTTPLSSGMKLLILAPVVVLVLCVVLLVVLTVLSATH
jgi:serine/threonine-protein kinase